MGFRKEITLLLSILIAGNAVFAQLRMANRYFDELQYAKAIPLYLKEVKKNESPEAILKLADCYRLTRNYEQAEVFYAKAVQYPEVDPEAHYHYGNILKNNHKVQEAKEVFVVYATKNPRNSVKGEKQAFSCEKIEEWADTDPEYEIENLEQLNSRFADFSAVPYENGLIFVSERNTDHVTDMVFGWTEKPYLSIFYAQKKNDTEFKKPKTFSNKLNSEYHNGPISFNEQRNEAIYTGVHVSSSKDRETIFRPQLFVSKRKNGKWQNAEPFEHNNPDYSLAHPALSPSGDTLYFVSDMPGGQGKKDLYMCKREDDHWGKPENLGSAVNTHSNEMFPVVHPDGSLYFSSDGHIGYGGLDIFRSTVNDDRFTAPENLKEPVNSGRDDFGFNFLTKSTGIFTSNRNGGSGDDDLYSFSYHQKMQVSGIFLYSMLDPGKNKKISLLDENDEVIKVTTTNENGEFFFESIGSEKNYSFAVDEDDVKLTDEATIYLTNMAGGKIVELKQDKKGSFGFRLLTPDIYKSLPLLEVADERFLGLNLLGKAYKELPGDYPPGLEVNLINDNGEIVYTTTVDENGDFNFTNLPPDQHYIVKLGVADPELKISFLDQDNATAFNAKRLDQSSFAIEKSEISEEEASALFGRVFETLPGETTKGMTVYLVNDEGVIIATTMTDENGDFNFNRLPPDQKYFVKLREKDDGEIKIKFIDQGGKDISDAGRVNGSFEVDRMALQAPESVDAEAIQSVLSLFGQVYEELPGDYSSEMEVYILNDQGEIIYTTTTDAKGNFTFTNLPSAINYVVKIKEMDEDVKIIFFDENGDLVDAAKRTETGNFVIDKPEQKVTAETVDLAGMAYEKSPGDIHYFMEVELIDNTGQVVATTLTDEFGNFIFEKLPPDKNYILKFKEEDVELKISLFNEAKDLANSVEKTATGDIIVEQPENTEEGTMDLFGMAFDKLPGDYHEGLEVYLVNDEGNIISTAVTDEYGNFKFDKLPSDKNYFLRLKEENNDINIVFINEVIEPAKDNNGDFIYEYLPSRKGQLALLTESDEVIRIMDNYPLPTIYYDYDKASIGDEGLKKLNTVVTLLKKNRHIGVEMSAHTDSRGPSDYNEQLAKSRLNSAISYLVGKGISRSRIIGNSYGERILINRCSDNADCTEEEHLLNRRTEIRVITKIPAPVSKS